METGRRIGRRRALAMDRDGPRANKLFVAVRQVVDFPPPLPVPSSATPVVTRSIPTVLAVPFTNPIVPSVQSVCPKVAQTKCWIHADTNVFNSSLHASAFTGVTFLRLLEPKFFSEPTSLCHASCLVKLTFDH